MEWCPRNTVGKIRSAMDDAVRSGAAELHDSIRTHRFSSTSSLITPRLFRPRLETIICVAVVLLSFTAVTEQACSSISLSDPSRVRVAPLTNRTNVVKLSCNDTSRFTSSGSSTSTCTGNGTWAPDPLNFVCYAKCRLPPSLDEDGVSVYPLADSPGWYNHGDRVELFCSSTQQVLLGPSEAQCDDGGWRPANFPSCHAAAGERDSHHNRVGRSLLASAVTVQTTEVSEANRDSQTSMVTEQTGRETTTSKESIGQDFSTSVTDYVQTESLTQLGLTTQSVLTSVSTSETSKPTSGSQATKVTNQAETDFMTSQERTKQSESTSSTDEMSLITSAQRSIKTRQDATSASITEFKTSEATSESQSTTVTNQVDTEMMTTQLST
ncbi:uncharacterized protein, partial [Diadema antillarum]|uniref:uncharacterized protein n=1 Tax=Diadema antillarum TaxID=105358 RepID=UPI003A851027